MCVFSKVRDGGCVRSTGRERQREREGEGGREREREGEREEEKEGGKEGEALYTFNNISGEEIFATSTPPSMVLKKKIADPFEKNMKKEKGVWPSSFRKRTFWSGSSSFISVNLSSPNLQRQERFSLNAVSGLSVVPNFKIFFVS